MLELFGMIGANALSLPGILGLGFGMMTRRFPVAIVGGAVIGLVETVVFANFDFAEVFSAELVVSIGIGVVAGAAGCLFRRKGALV